MALLFFEGFNVKNTDNTPYLDPRYWTIEEETPAITYYPESEYVTTHPDNGAIEYGTYRSLVISGYRLDTIPAQYPVPIQLSGVSGLDSDQIYISFRVANLGHSHTYGLSYPYTTKFLTLCSGNKELLSFDVVKTTGLSIQGGTWTPSNQGLGISVKQTGSNNSMTQIGLFDFRVQGLPKYSIYNFSSSSNDFMPTMIEYYYVTNQGYDSHNKRFLHIELFVNTAEQKVRMKIDGFDVLNRATRAPYGPTASGSKPFGSFDNIKFYHKGIIGTAYTNSNIDYGNLIIDDLAICNNSGEIPNTWMGPNTRIIHLNSIANPSNTGLTDWEGNAGSNTSRLDTNDGDTSYISSQTTGQIYSQRMRFTQINDITDYFGPSDNIGGLRMFNSVRKTFLDSDFVNVYSSGEGLDYSQNGTLDGSDPAKYYEIGDTYQIDHTNYFIRNSFVLKNPITNLPWDTGVFFTQLEGENAGIVKTSGYFGVKKL
jgi:hypothetical protein